MAYNDSRDVIRDFEALEAERESYAEVIDALPDDISDEAREMIMRHTDWSPEKEEEWQALRDACDEGSGYPDWHHGAELIPEEDFNGDKAEETCRDLGYLPNDFPSWIVVDWDATADNLKQDYSTMNIGEETYYIRS